MELQALKITRKSTLAPVPVTMDATSEETLEALLLVEEPTVFVIDKVALALLSSLFTGFVDRGEKHPATPLSNRLLGQEGTPFIQGSYTSPGRFLQSVEALLDNAEERGECKAYLVGTDTSLMRDLREKGRPRTTDPSSLGRPIQGQSPTPGGGSTHGAPSHASLLDLLPELDVPAELTKQYIGRSPAAQLVRQLILRAAKQDDPVLIIGDTGTGKEIIARSIHLHGKRRARRFTAVNCGGIPESLLESELFGHKRGSFTGAVTDKVGLWASAGTGTLFLDEIGDLSPDHQAKLLRVLQEGTIRPVGGDKEANVGARVLAATNRDLFTMVRAGTFREDLYYRLRSFLIRTPSLRAYPEDVPRLAGHFWRSITSDPNATLPEPVLRELTAYRWPGNVRELKAVLANLHALFPEEPIGAGHLIAVFRHQGQATGTGISAGTRVEIDQRKVEFLSHVRRVDDAIRACRVTLEPMADDPGLGGATMSRVRAGLRRCLLELSILCEPRLFPSETSFMAAHELKGRLSYFEALLDDDSSEARLRGWKDVALELDGAQAAVAKEIQLLKQNG